jgi:hypothetical protein
MQQLYSQPSKNILTRLPLVLNNPCTCNDRIGFLAITCGPEQCNSDGGREHLHIVDTQRDEWNFMHGGRSLFGYLFYPLQVFPHEIEELQVTRVSNMSYGNLFIWPKMTP